MLIQQELEIFFGNFSILFSYSNDSIKFSLLFSQPSFVAIFKSFLFFLSLKFFSFLSLLDSLEQQISSSLNVSQIILVLNPLISNLLSSFTFVFEESLSQSNFWLSSVVISILDHFSLSWFIRIQHLVISPLTINRSPFSFLLWRKILRGFK